jgi:hypothetical protein
MVRSGGTVAQVKATVKAGAEHHQGTHHSGGVGGRPEPTKKLREVRLGLGRVNLHYRRIKPATCNSVPTCSDAVGACVEQFILYNAKSPADGPGANPAAGLIDPSIAACGAYEEATTSYLSVGRHAASISLLNMIVDADLTHPLISCRRFSA